MIITSQAIIFDLDGVLVDSTDLIEKHWRRFAMHKGLDPDYVIEVAHGRRTEDVLTTLYPDIDSQSLAAKLEYDEGDDTDGLKIFRGVRQLLESLPAGRWAVATSGAKRTALTRLKFGKLPIPDVLITAEQVTEGKPDPDVFLKAAAGLNIDPEHCVVVEDSPAGVQAAVHSAMQVVAVETSHKCHELRKATAIIPDAGHMKIHNNKHQNNLQIRLKKTL